MNITHLESQILGDGQSDDGVQNITNRVSIKTVFGYWINITVSSEGTEITVDDKVVYED